MTHAIDVPDGPLVPAADLRERLLDPAMIAVRQAAADRLLVAEGAGHLVHDLPVRADGRIASLESRPWRLDPVPVVLDASTFGWLASVVGQRMEALELVLADLYGPRTLVHEQIVPAEAIGATPRYRLDAVGQSPARWLSSYAVDLVVDAGGVWHVVQDLTNVVPGLGYALLDRSVMDRVVPEIAGTVDVAPLGRFTGALRRALVSVSGVESPRIVLFSGGIDHPSYIDNSYLAVELGVNLVEGADLVVRQRRVWLRALDGFEPVDVLFRRLDDARVDPLAVASVGSAGVPGLLQAIRSDGVVLANAHGAGIVEAAALQPHLDDAVAHVAVGSPSVSLSLPDSVPLAQVPLAPGSVARELAAAAVVVRLFAVHDGDSVTVLPGGSGRVLAPGDDPRAPTACTAKDVWVVGHAAPVRVGLHLPQVDFGRSVPTRAADALYWANRSAERAEAMARTLRVITARIDPTGRQGADWTMRMAAFASGVRRVGEPPRAVSLGALHDELSAVGDAVATEIGSLLTEATTVREFLSVTTGRVLAQLVDLRAAFQQHRTGVDDLDAALAHFAAIAGLWQESTVRGPAWTIGDAGRRLERALVVLDLVDALLDARPGTGDDTGDVDAAAIEVLLAANESLVAYRRRHRSEVELDAALQLVLHDETNPRSLASALAQIARHAEHGDWPVVAELVEHARVAMEMPTATLLVEVRAAIVDTGARVVNRWFSTPVDPIVMRPTEGQR